MKTIWLSGSNGFLGKNLLESLNKNYQCNPILRVADPQELKGDILIHCGWISASNSNDLNNSNQIDNITECLYKIKPFIANATSEQKIKLLNLMVEAKTLKSKSTMIISSISNSVDYMQEK